MSIFKELIGEFPYYVGQKLEVSQQNIRNNLHKLVGKPTNFYAYYEAIKECATLQNRRSFVLELLEKEIEDFMGSDLCKKDLRDASQKIELETLESYLSFVYCADSDWNQWRKMIVNFGLKSPKENVNIRRELKRIGLPECYEKSINGKSLKYYSADRRLRNLAFTTLSEAKHNKEIKTAFKIQLYFLDKYYRYQGIELKLHNYEGSYFTREVNELWSTKIPFLPKLPGNWYYDYNFYEYIRNVVRGEQNLYNIEWKLTRTIRFDNHSLVVCSLDRTSNDHLSGVESIKDLLYMPDQSDWEQEQALTLLRGDACNAIYTNFTDCYGLKTEKEHKFMRQWFDEDCNYVTTSILKCRTGVAPTSRKVGDFDMSKMKQLITSRFYKNKYKLQKMNREIDSCYLEK